MRPITIATTGKGNPHLSMSSFSNPTSEQQRQNAHCYSQQPQNQRYSLHSSPSSNSNCQTLSSGSNQPKLQGDDVKSSIPPSFPPTSKYDLMHHHHLTKPKPPSKCSLFCVFYAEFDNIVGPKICFQSPKHFMNQDMYVSTHIIHDLLKKTFETLMPNPPTSSSSCKGMTPATDTKQTSQEEQNEESHAATDEKQQQQGQPVNSSHPCNHVQNPQAANINNPSSLSIFDSTSEYIITGNEIANKMMCLSTHNMHILTRPTIIVDHSQYQRNSLFFSVGFVIRRVEDPRPYRPLLSKLASTLRDMEVESQFLSKKETRFRMQNILEDILISLNSSSRGSGNSRSSTSAECNLLLNDANALNLKLFRTPRPPSSPVPDHAVPVLLRPEWQLHAYDWDLAINWIVPHVDGIKYARLIAQSSDVDIEIVRACLRVLKHHRVMAFVDIFRYSNVYESTPLASAMLAGKVPKLLNAAFYFASKTANRDLLPCSTYVSSPNILDVSVHSHNYQQQHHHNYQQQQKQHRHQQPLSSSFPRSSFVALPSQISASASSFPPTSMSSGGGGGGGGSSGVIGVGGCSPVTSPPPSLLNSSVARREHRIMKAALAHIYCACSRDRSFGDMLIAKVVKDINSNTHNAAGSSTTHNRQQAESNGKVSATNCQSKSSKKQMHHHQHHHARPYYQDHHPFSRKYEHSDSGGCLGVSEVAPMTSPIFRGDIASPGAGAGGSSSGACGSAGTPKKKKKDMKIDWSEAFDYFDHRRIITFGIIHGLIRRVHSYPLAFDDCDATVASDANYPFYESAIKGGPSSSSRFKPSGDQPTSSGDIGVDHSYRPSSGGGGGGGGGGDHRHLRHRHHHRHHPASTSPRLEPIHASPTAPSSPTQHQCSTFIGQQPESSGSGNGERDEQHQAKKFHVAGPGGTNSSTSAPPSLSMPPPVAAKQQQEQHTRREDLHNFARAVAESMDGTKCDDELSCMYQMSLPELIEVVQKIGKKSVMAISSTSIRH